VLPSSLKDDRGRPVRVITPGWRAVAAILAAGGEAAAKVRAALALPEFVWRLRVALLFFCACVCLSAASIYNAVLAGIAFTPWYRWTPLPQAVLIVFNVWLIWRSARRHDEQVVSGLLKAAMCPACGYGLGDIPPELDGCSVCPECGAAWRRAASSVDALDRRRRTTPTTIPSPSAAKNVYLSILTSVSSDGV
jgi:hypothetical protein